MNSQGFFFSGNTVPASPALNVCNGKGWWGVLEGLVLLAAGGSIVVGGDLLLLRRSIVARGVSFC